MMPAKRDYSVLAAVVILLILFVMCLRAPCQTPVVYHQGYRMDATGTVLLNDLAVTPGSVREVTSVQLCDPTFHTITIRNVPEKVKRQACALYGVIPCDGHVEIDHLISLELGGSNDLKNLWPQPYLPKPGAREKDVVENWLHRQVCNGHLTLLEAQQAIATNWYKVYIQRQVMKGLK